MRATQVRLRFYARIGLIVIVLSGVLGFLWLGLPGVALAASLSALVWWKIVAPPLRRRHADELADLPSWSLEADKDA